MSLPTLNVVGTGKLGSTLARLLVDADLVQAAGLYSRNPDHASRAAAFVGGGRVIDDTGDMPAARLWLISVPDDAIASVARQLAGERTVWDSRVVFHCSGLLDASALAPLRQRGAAVASLHPAHSFADPGKSLQTFAGTCCTLEGDETATSDLKPLFEAIGARIIDLKAEAKPLYHAATAMASNYLVALVDMSLDLLGHAGLSREDSLALLAPLVTSTAGNAVSSGPKRALTGPLCRGDSATVRRHLEAIAAANPALVPVYLTLGRQTLSLARRARPQNRAKHDQVQAMLDRFEIPYPPEA